MLQNARNRTLDAIALELEQRVPDSSVGDLRLSRKQITTALVIQVLLEQVEQRLEIDKLRRMVGVDLAQITQHFLAHISYQASVIPDFIEPLLQILAVTATIDHQVQLKIVLVLAQPQPAHREVRAAHDRFLDRAIGNVIQLAMQQTSALDRANLHFLLDPGKALAGQSLLL